MTRTPDPRYPDRTPQLGEQTDWPLGPVDFSGDVPPPAGYRCTICNARGVRLWREYNCIATYITLHCFDCALLRGGGIEKPYSFQKGDYTPDDGEIHGIVGAVPVAEGDTFWGFGAMPADGVAWWKGLKPRPDAEWTREQQLAAQRDEWRRAYGNVDQLRKMYEERIDELIRKSCQISP